MGKGIYALPGRAVLGKYPVIYIDFSEVPENCVSYHAYISRVLDGLKRDLSEEFSEIVTDTGT